jgi:hypothetical protein
MMNRSEMSVSRVPRSGRESDKAYAVVFPRDVVVAERFGGDVVDVDLGVDWDVAA